MLEYEDLYNVILVGHSCAGMVISGVAEKVANRISRLVYLDAFFPENKKSVVDYLIIPSLNTIVSSKGDGWRIPFLGTIEDLGVRDRKDIDWAKPRVGDQPYKTFTEIINLTNPGSGISGTFIQLSGFPWFVNAGERARRMGFNCHQMLSGGHDAMISAPNETALANLQIL
jgi:hypothetical protein